MFFLPQYLKAFRSFTALKRGGQFLGIDRPFYMYMMYMRGTKKSAFGPRYEELTKKSLSGETIVVALSAIPLQFVTNTPEILCLVVWSTSGINDQKIGLRQFRRIGDTGVSYNAYEMLPGRTASINIDHNRLSSFNSFIDVFKRRRFVILKSAVKVSQGAVGVCTTLASTSTVNIIFRPIINLVVQNVPGIGKTECKAGAAHGLFASFLNQAPVDIQALRCRSFRYDFDLLALNRLHSITEQLDREAAALKSRRGANIKSYCRFLGICLRKIYPVTPFLAIYALVLLFNSTFFAMWLKHFTSRTADNAASPSSPGEGSRFNMRSATFIIAATRSVKEIAEIHVLSTRKNPARKRFISIPANAICNLTFKSHLQFSWKATYAPTGIIPSNNNPMSLTSQSFLTTAQKWPLSCSSMEIIMSA